MSSAVTALSNAVFADGSDGSTCVAADDDAIVVVGAAMDCGPVMNPSMLPSHVVIADAFADAFDVAVDDVALADAFDVALHVDAFAFVCFPMAVSGGNGDDTHTCFEPDSVDHAFTNTTHTHTLFTNTHTPLWSLFFL